MVMISFAAIVVVVVDVVVIIVVIVVVVIVIVIESYFVHCGPSFLNAREST